MFHDGYVPLPTDRASSNNENVVCLVVLLYSTDTDSGDSLPASCAILCVWSHLGLGDLY